MQRDPHASNQAASAALNGQRPRGRARQRAYLIAVVPDGGGEQLAELRELLRTAGVAGVGELIQRRDHPHPNTYLGLGKLDELKAEIARSDANLVACDDELSPRQERNLESALGVPVIDRTAIILDIFASHAHSAEGKLQVELAQLEYNLARMRGLWSHLERLGAGRIDGGIGTRGPGETQIETDRRLARDRISALKRKLAHVGSNRSVMRAERERSHLPSVALAGYTNAGKSTLLNALTGSTVGVRDRLFHTLDPTTRLLRAGGHDYLLTDTVGFIRKLPHQLVDAFGATLEETRRADLILHVVDASVPEDELVAMTRAVEDVLLEIAADAVPQILVLAKADRIDDERRAELQHRHPGAVLVSAATGEGVGDTRAADRGGVRPHAPGRRAPDPVPGGRATRRAPRDRRRPGARGDARRRARPGSPAGVGGRALSGLLAEPYVRMTLQVRRLDAACGVPTRAYAGDAGLDLYALEERELGPGSAPRSAPGSRSRSPTGQAGLVLPRSGLAASHGIAIVNAPGLIDSGYRGEVRVLLLNTDREQGVHDHRRRPDRPARAGQQSRRRRSRRSTSWRCPSAAAGGFGSSGWGIWLTDDYKTGRRRRQQPSRLEKLLRDDGRVPVIQHARPRSARASGAASAARYPVDRGGEHRALGREDLGRGHRHHVPPPEHVHRV